MKKILSAAALAAAMMCAAPALAVTYDAGAQFTGDITTSAPWSYGYFAPSSTTFVPLQDLGTFFGEPDQQNWNTPLVAPEGGSELLMHPGPAGQLVVLRFTTAFAGNYLANFRAMEIDNSNPSCSNCDGVKMILGAQSEDVGHLTGVHQLTQSFVFGAGGGTIDFVLDPKGNYGWDSTGVTATVAVPEPAAWALMILGFGGVGAMLRHTRRRTAALAA
jgi:hypothetical protein